MYICVYIPVCIYLCVLMYVCDCTRARIRLINIKECTHISFERKSLSFRMLHHLFRKSSEMTRLLNMTVMKPAIWSYSYH